MKFKWIFAAVVIVLVGAIGAIYATHRVRANVAIPPEQAFYVMEEWSSMELLDEIINQNVLKRTWLLDSWADVMSFHTSTVKPGKYHFRSSETTYDVLNKLRRGEQSPITIAIERQHSIAAIAGHLGRTLMYDSTHYADYLQTYVSDTFLCNLVPNSYELYWTTDASSFYERMENERQRYWQGHDGSILGHPMSTCEIYTLASIVERESQYAPERARIAGVYINRLKRGIPLQADPTVIYSLNDPSIRRVLFKHLEHPSPYNTYVHAGLPPGPICMPSLHAIQAVRQAEHHDYLYFCAKPDNSGTHAFAETLRQHNVNARAFQRWLNQRGIR